MTQLTVVLDCLRSAGLTTKPSKCQFGMSRCTYLGHVIGGSHVCLDPSKIQSVDSFPTPTNKKQVNWSIVEVNGEATSWVIRCGGSVGRFVTTLEGSSYLIIIILVVI